ncbi:MAG: bifunctional nicotinamidase/pyrazinamidase [Spirochaetes bacterium]|nr:bifunctional nicotinamidase/pyrazinamidase [Spirochaetota bacterium]MBU0954582.1 bifunctional nicotinamidase/pyrazinamidase [Spirochaetota bacterium]
MRALIVVDVQNDFVPGGALTVPDGHLIIPLINRLMQRFPLVVATQDWHPAGHASFASSHAGRRAFDTVLLNGGEQVLWPDHCVQGSSGAAFADGLDTTAFAAIFRKGMNPAVDSYSAFYDNLRLQNTGLAGYLRGLQVDELYFCGLAADICVHFSTMDALREGFTVNLIQDASKELDAADYARTRQVFAQAGGRLLAAAALF